VRSRAGFRPRTRPDPSTTSGQTGRIEGPHRSSPIPAFDGGAGCAAGAGRVSTLVRFERLIGTFQVVAQRLVDGYIDVEAIRLALWQVAWRLVEGLPAATEVATAKFWAADGGHRVAHRATDIWRDRY
jgi:alkylation response protein AidB-like acyl-CoA dehydrogenase